MIWIVVNYRVKLKHNRGLAWVVEFLFAAHWLITLDDWLNEKCVGFDTCLPFMRAFEPMSTHFTACSIFLIEWLPYIVDFSRTCFAMHVEDHILELDASRTLRAFRWNHFSFRKEPTLILILRKPILSLSLFVRN